MNTIMEVPDVVRSRYRSADCLTIPPGGCEVALAPTPVGIAFFSGGDYADRDQSSDRETRVVAPARLRPSGAEPRRGSGEAAERSAHDPSRRKVRRQAGRPAAGHRRRPAGALGAPSPGRSP